MMKALFQQKGANLDIGIIASDEAQDFITRHAEALDSAMAKVGMTETMRDRLKHSNYIFSGLKTFHELNEAFPSLTDQNGDRKTFERFLNDVQKVNETYNRNYLRAEYNFVHASASMAARWEMFQKDGDRYLLQYRTAGDDKVRPAHAALNGTTLPITDSFWDSYFPPNGWNCRCTAVQVRRGKYDETPHDEAMQRGEDATGEDKKGIFNFNSGKKQKTFPDYNPYTIKRCNDCSTAQGKADLAYVPDNELCAACRIVRACAKADAKQTKAKAKPLQGTNIYNSTFNRNVLISKNSIKEWTNQPYKHFNEKNRMLLNIKDVFAQSEYIGQADNHKNVEHLKLSHIFKTMIKDEDAYIIVREYDDGLFILHSISEGGELLKHIKKGSDK